MSLTSNDRWSRQDLIRHRSCIKLNGFTVNDDILIEFLHFFSILSRFRYFRVSSPEPNLKINKKRLKEMRTFIIDKLDFIAEGIFLDHGHVIRQLYRIVP